MKKLALALVCLVSVAFFASCDPKVENPEPSIAVLEEAGLVKTGDLVNENDTVRFGFKVASNAETLEKLASLIITVDGAGWDTVSFTDETEYTYKMGIIFPSSRDTIVGTKTIAAVVKDAAGKTNTASIELTLNYHELPLTAAEFTWKREGSNPGEGLDMFGLEWTKNAKGEPFAIIKPIEGVKLYEIPAEKWAEITTVDQKQALFSDGNIATAIEQYDKVSAWAGHEFNDVIATLYNGNYYMIHIMKSTVNTKGTTIVIEGEWK